MGIIDNNKKGIKVKSLNGILMVITCVLCVVILYFTFSAKKKYNHLFLELNDYTECNKAITQLKDATDYLSNQARLYVINCDVFYLKNYLNELKNIHTRENAIDILELSHVDDEPDKNLRLAFEESQYISQIELYAMKLASTAENLPRDTIPDELYNISLSQKDENLSAQEKLDRAKNLLFDETYVASKARISKYCSIALNSIMGSYLTNQTSGDKSFSESFLYMRVGIIFLLSVNILLYVLLIILILHPLYKHNKSIEVGKRMKNIGSYEIRYIANTYNSLIEKNEIKASILKHKAEHDSLTGLINREAFDQIKKILSESSEQIAYLIIDIDYFKNINDTYGHMTGDDVLKKIAFLLSDQFRNTDYVARIGGDEFAIIMTKFGDSPEKIIQTKIENMNKILQNRFEGLPPVSLSVGVSFSPCGYRNELDEQADKALYRVKKGGRCNCSFYDFESNDKSLIIG